MIKHVSRFDFTDALKQDDYNDFSHEAIQRIWEYIEEIEEATDEDIMLDIVSLRCDFSEFESEEEAREYLGIANSEDLDSYGNVLECDNGHIILQNI